MAYRRQALPRPSIRGISLGHDDQVYAPQHTQEGIASLTDWYFDRSYDTSFGSPAVRKTILRMYRARASKDFVGWEDKLRQLLEHKPAIVLWGDQDPFVSPTYADRFGQAEVYHFKEYSHWLPLEAPQQYVDALLPWLRKLQA